MKCRFPNSVKFSLLLENTVIEKSWLIPHFYFVAEYPWQVAILKKEEFDNVYVCGGSLIDGSHLLTAAHCVKGIKPSELR